MQIAGHQMLPTTEIVLNDTVTREFSAHINDRKQYIYYNYSGWEYYIVQ